MSAGAAQGQSICLACVRFWVEFPAYTQGGGEREDREEEGEEEREQT